jgi:hypothetical protein
MNCFNIRELQGILKRRFFADLVNSADHRDILSTSMIGLRFKNNNTMNLDHDTLAFFKLGTNNSNKLRTANYQNYYLDFLTMHNMPFSGKIQPLSLSSVSSYYLSLALTMFVNVINLFSFTPLVSTLSFFKASTLTSIVDLFKLNLGFIFNVNTTNPTTNNLGNLSGVESSRVNYSSMNFYSMSSIKYSFLEQESLSRFSRFSNPIISYDYKCGNYIGIWDKLYPSLMTSFIEVARGIRKAP